MTLVLNFVQQLQHTISAWAADILVKDHFGQVSQGQPSTQLAPNEPAGFAQTGEDILCFRLRPQRCHEDSGDPQIIGELHIGHGH
jgi:hypothetical protein